MTAPVRFPRFFVTSPAPCPYLPGRSERKVFTELKGLHADQLNEALGRIGFRRSQTVAYRPSCLDCQACVSVRVVAESFEPSSTQRAQIPARITFRRSFRMTSPECRAHTGPKPHQSRFGEGLRPGSPGAGIPGPA